jgi:hypothetical protein
VTSENTPDKNATGKDVRSEADQWIDAVAKLIELTQNGEMQWRVGGRRTPSSGEPTTPAYYANYGKHTRAFGSGAQKDRYDVNLDLVDENGLSLYRVPNISPVSDLFDIVQKQTAGDEALNELLG